MMNGAALGRDARLTGAGFLRYIILHDALKHRGKRILAILRQGTRRSAIRHYILLLAVAVVAAGTSQAHAGPIVAYNQTTTPSNTNSFWNPYVASTTSGDSLLGMLQSEASQLSSEMGPFGGKFGMKGLVFAYLYNQTDGFTTSLSSTQKLELFLFMRLLDRLLLFLASEHIAYPLPNNYVFNLPPNFPTSLPGMSLANNNPNTGLGTASVSSSSGSSTAHTPEPQSLTLFLVGIAGLSVRGLRRRPRLRCGL